MPPLAVPGLDDEGVDASDELSDAIESLPGEGKASNHSCGGLGGGGPQEAAAAEEDDDEQKAPSALAGNASGGTGGLCCCCCCPRCCCWSFHPGA